MSLINTSWPAFTETSKYPFTDESSLISSLGQKLANTVFLDGALTISGATAPLYLNQIDVQSQRLIFSIGDAVTRNIATGVYQVGEAISSIRFTDVYGRDAGCLVTDTARLATVAAWPPGVHEFLPTSSQFAARVHMCPPGNGVTSLLDNDEVSFSGDVWIIGDDGVVVRNINGAIRIDVVGDPLFRRRLCDVGFEQNGRAFVKTINGMEPNSVGELAITAKDHAKGSVIRITQTQNGIEISAAGA